MDPSVAKPPFPVVPEFLTSTAVAPAPASALFPAPALPLQAITAVPAANPSPSDGSVPSHPPYAEMITAAILALQEKDGSSKKAISKYIDRVCPNLPPAHPALLTHHLERLKNSGQLVMIKKSYILPASPHPRSDPTTHPPTASTNVTTSITSSSPPLKRRPGRHPKNRELAQQSTYTPAQKPTAHGPCPISETSLPQGDGFPGHDGPWNGGIVPPQQQQKSKRRGRPPKPKVPVPLSDVRAQPTYTAQPSYASNSGSVDLGLLNGSASVPGKRRPGRPPRAKDVATTNAAMGGVEMEGPAQVAVGSASIGPALGKRRPGRPPRKIRVVSVLRPGGKPRGRPRKNAVALAVEQQQVGAVEQQQVGAVVASTVPPSVGGAKRRGRPSMSRLSGDVRRGVVGGKRRGRPPRRGGAQLVPKRGSGRGGWTGRRVGRPKKISSTLSLRVPVQSEVANEELAGKLEYMQLKVKKAVGLLRPHVHNLDNLDVMTALEDLQELTEMDLTITRVYTMRNAPTAEITASTVDVTPM